MISVEIEQSINSSFLLLTPLGGSLGDLLADQRRTGMRLATNDLAQILMQVAQGLKYIHAQGLVHMDIKPGISADHFLSN
jgi:serine/threonine protein kinase